MKIGILIALVLLSAGAHAEVCTALKCESTKTLIEMEPSSLAVWCPDGATIPDCPSRQMLRWGNFQDYSWALTKDGTTVTWLRRGSIIDQPAPPVVIPQPPSFVFKGYHCNPSSTSGAVLIETNDNDGVAIWYCDYPLEVKYSTYCFNPRFVPNGAWIANVTWLAKLITPLIKRPCTVDEKALAAKLNREKGIYFTVYSATGAKDVPFYDAKPGYLLGKERGRIEPDRPEKRAFCLPTHLQTSSGLPTSYYYIGNGYYANCKANGIISKD